MSRAEALACCLTSRVALGVSNVGDAQPYPSKPIHIAWFRLPPGGPADLLVRGLGIKLAEKWGRRHHGKLGQRRWNHHRGRSGRQGCARCSASSDAVCTLNAQGVFEAAVDPGEGFGAGLEASHREPVARRWAGLSCQFGQGIRRRLRQQNPGKLSYGSVGAGGVNHLAMSWFNKVWNGLQEHVPSKGLVQALQDVITGRIDTMFAVIGGALPFVPSNKLKALAVSGKAVQHLQTFDVRGSWLSVIRCVVLFRRRGARRHPARHRHQVRERTSRIVNCRRFQGKIPDPNWDSTRRRHPRPVPAFLVNDRKIGAEKVKVCGAKLD